MVVIGAFAILAGCGSNGPAASPMDSAVNTVAQASGNTAAETAPTTPTVVVLPPGSTAIPADVADNFVTATGLQPYQQGGSTPGGEPVGAFRITCRPGQLLKDDPVVSPGKPGVAHLHQFAGSKGTNAFTTYATLRTVGGTTCGTDAAPVNRSAYWFPAMLDGAGNVVLPDYFNIYYKQLPKTNSNCLMRSAGCVPLPNGLKFIAGYDMARMANDGAQLYFECWHDDITSTSVPGTGRTRTLDALVKQGCPAGALVIAQIVSQECWDGKNADSADHRSHVAYNDGTGVNVGDQNGGGQRCPKGWYLIPDIFVRMVFTTDANFVAGKWRLSSDDMLAQMTGQPVAAGTTLHFDYMEGWSPTVKAMWQQNCIDGHLSCSGGALGNGQEIKGSGPPPGGWVRHQLVPLSSVP